MKVQCEICSKDVEVVTSVCCTGSTHNIECGCGGQEQYEGRVLCDNCFDFLEQLEIRGMAIHTDPKSEEGKKFALTTDDCAEVE